LAELFSIGYGWIIFIVFHNFSYLGNSKNLDHLCEIFCLCVSFFGLGIRAITIGYTPRKTSGRNTKRQIAESLNVTGIYSVVRNPLYLGNFFMYLGVVLFFHLWWLVIIYMLAFWLYYERIIFAEEEFLRKKFMKQYLEWANKTPAFFPNFKHYQAPKLSFSIRNVLRREYNGFFAVILLMFLLEIIGDWFVEHRVEFDIDWLIALGIGFVIWTVLRCLKKYTTVLNVEGR